MAIPIIDERIKHVGPGTLRKMDALKLRGLRDLVVIQVDDEPLAVLIPYEMYLEMQKEVSEACTAISQALPTTVYDRNWFNKDDFERQINPDDYGKLPDGVPYTVNDGTEHNPDMAYSKDSYIEPENERRKVPRSGSTVNVPHHESKSDIANDIVAPSPGPHPPIRGIPFITENKPEPFQGPSRSGDVPICDHCGGPGVSLCPACFMAGHRAVANCQQCAERVK